jgi:hypothetical protein
MTYFTKLMERFGKAPHTTNLPTTVPEPGPVEGPVEGPPAVATPATPDAPSIARD